MDGEEKHLGSSPQSEEELDKDSGRQEGGSSQCGEGGGVVIIILYFRIPKAFTF